MGRQIHTYHTLHRTVGWGEVKHLCLGGGLCHSSVNDLGYLPSVERVSKVCYVSTDKYLIFGWLTVYVRITPGGDSGRWHILWGARLLCTEYSVQTRSQETNNTKEAIKRETST